MRFGASKRLFYNNLADCISPDDTVVHVRRQGPRAILAPGFSARHSSGRILAVRAAQTVEVIKRRFAGCDHAIEQAYGSSESFRGLCRDYLACAGALARWRASDSVDAHARTEEYAALLDELGTEIQARLQGESPPGLHQPSRVQGQDKT